MDLFRGAMIIIWIRAFAAVGLAVIGVYNLATDDVALGVLWLVIAAIFGWMAYQRMQRLRADSRAGRIPPA